MPSDINEAIAEVLRLEAESTEPGAWDIIEEHTYYRTAAPALAREVQRLQAEVDRLRGPHRHCYHCLEDLPQGATDDCCDGCRDQLRRDEEAE